MQQRRQGALLALAVVAGVALTSLLALTTQLVVIPADGPAVLVSRTQLPPHWHKATDATSGKTYYWNRNLATSSWNPPNPDGSVAEDVVPQAAMSGMVQDQDAQGAKLHDSGAHYHVTNTGDQDAEDSNIFQSDEEAADAADNMGDSGSDDAAADWQGDDDFSQTAAARQSDWGFADDHVDGSSLQLNSPIQLHPVQSLGGGAAPNLPGPPGGTQAGADPAAQPAGADADGEEGAEDDEKEISDITGYPDWPSDLPGAYGDDTSWIVGEHREPLWSDSMTNACGLTTPCEKGRADRGHAFQKTVNPWTDKRRTFDPYAQATEEGRNDYPWDPTRDPKYYGKKDCGDGVLRDECFEKPTEDELKKKKQEWRRKYDEWFTGKEEGEGEEDSAGEEEEEAAQQKAEATNAALMKVPKELTPWAKAEVPGLGRKAATGHFAGGEPVARSFGHFVKKVEGDLQEGVQALSSMNVKGYGLREWGRKFLRANGQRGAGLQGAGGAQTQMLVEEDVAAQTAAAQEKVAAAAAAASPAAKKASAAGKGEEGRKAGGAGVGEKSIWESPLEVMKRGLFGEAGGGAGKKRADGAEAAKEAAAALEKKAAKEGGKAKGPLPAALEDAAKVTEEGAGKEEKAGKKAGKKVKGWEEAVMQKSAMKEESAASSMKAALRARDHKLLEKTSGLSWSKLKSLEDTAAGLERDIAGAAKSVAGAKGKKGAGKAKKAVSGWEEKEMQIGAMRHQSVEANLKQALGKRELSLLEKKGGWKSQGELQRALRFADNLEAAIKDRRAEERKHPLIPKAAKKALHIGLGDGGEKKRTEHEAIKAEGEEAADRRVVQRVREEAPIVKAYEAQVRDDEQEYEGEMSEERLTLSKLHRDQAKLTRAIEAEEGGQKKASGGQGGSDGSEAGEDAVEEADDTASEESEAAAEDGREGEAGEKGVAGLSMGEGSLMKLQSLSAGKVKAPTHGMSAAQADKDIDAFFDSENGK